MKKAKIRYKFLGATMGAISLGMAAFIATQVISNKKYEAPNLKRDNFIATLTKLSETHKYIILSDTNHSSVEIQELLADPEVIEALAGLNINLVVREGPVEQNRDFDDIEYAAEHGLISRKELLDLWGESSYNGNDPVIAERYRRAKANQIYYLSEAGIEHHYADERFGSMPNDANFEAFRDQAARYLNGDDVAYAMVAIGALVNKDPNMRLGSALFDEFASGNIETDNQAIADNTREAASFYNPFGTTLIVYGDGHREGTNDLDEMLGQEDTVSIVLFPTPQSINLADENTQDLPEYYYDITTDNMVKVVAGTESEQAYRAREKTHLTFAEYESAVANLPDDLIEYALPYEDYDDNPDNDTRSEAWWNAEDLRDEPNIPASAPELAS